MNPPVRSVLALSTLLLFGASATAFAAPSSPDIPTKIVRFNRADLATAGGAHALYERISAAARIVCRSTTPRAAVRACRERAIDEAVRAVDSPLLSSIHGSAADRIEEVVRR
jgi:UrcA family protein